MEALSKFLANDSYARLFRALMGWLFVLLLIFKLTGRIHCSWWMVAGPLWIPTGAVLAFAIVNFPFWVRKQKREGKW